MAASIEAELVPVSIVGLVSIALAACLLFLNVGHRSHRALALVLFLRGTYLAIAAIPGAGIPSSPWFALSFYLHVGFPFSALYLVYVLHYRPIRFEARTPPLPHPIIPMVLLGMALAVSGAFFLDHGLVASADPTWGFVPGPLHVLDAAAGFVVVGCALFLLGEACHSPKSRGSRSLHYLSIGLMASVVFEAATATWLYTQLRRESPQYLASPEFSPYLNAEVGLYLASIVLALGPPLLTTVRMRFRGRPDVAAMHARFLTVGVAAVASLGLVVAARQAGNLWIIAARLLAALWLMLLPAVTTFALVRLHLFGADARMSWLINRGTIGSILLASFFGFADVLQDFLGDQFGLLAGGVLTGLLLFAMHPLERLAHKVSKAAVPEAKPMSALSKEERIDLYREQAHLAWADGQLSRKERMLLDRLRDRLELTPTVCGRLEHDAYARGDAIRHSPFAGTRHRRASA